MSLLRKSSALAKPKSPAKKSHSRNITPSDADPFTAELEKRISQIVGRDQATQVIAQVITLFQEERFSGPIAHPKHLREYEKIHPGAADRIIAMAEDALKHNRMMQEKALKADVEDTKDGRKYGFCALSLLIISALISGLFDHEYLAGGFLTTGALGTVAIFIKGRIGKNGD